VQPSTSTASSADAAEAGAKADLVLEAAGPLTTADPATVRWLLCGRGRPVDAAAGSSPYTVVVEEGRREVWFQDNETSRVLAEERWEELGYEPVPYPWHAPPPEPRGDPAAVAPLRLALTAAEQDRYRAAGRDCAAAVVEAVSTLTPAAAEAEAAGELLARLGRRGFVVPVVLVAGTDRQRVHRHPLPTAARLARTALLAVTAERDGLHVSMTRIVSFGEPPAELARLVAAAATVDAAMLGASRPGTTTGAVLDVAAAAYERLGFPDEWRRHHQGGITGYRGREVFAVPGEPTPLREGYAVAWNPSIGGGAKSEDTALVRDGGVEVLTRTPGLPELEAGGLRRPGVAVL
jgi:Xaa-Pro dipeptidase